MFSISLKASLSVQKQFEILFETLQILPFLSSKYYVGSMYQWGGITGTLFIF
jgi:hypothetical protein